MSMFQGLRVAFWVLAMISVMAGLNLMVLAAAEQALGARHPASLGSGAAPEADGVLRVHAIEVVDGAGNVLIRMGVDESGDAAIVTMDTAGTPLTFMGQSDGAGMIATFDAQGRARAVIREPMGDGR